MDEPEWNSYGDEQEGQEFNPDIHCRRTGYTLSYFLIDFVKKHTEVQFLYGSDWKDKMTLTLEDKRVCFVPGMAIARNEDGSIQAILSLFRAEIYDGPKTVKILEYYEDKSKTFKTCIEQALEEIEGLWFKG